MKRTNFRWNDKIFVGGLIAIVVSAVIFCLPSFIRVSSENTFGLFIPNFLFAAGYFIFLLISGRLRKGRNGIYPLFLFLILFLISAYSLNREMVVFEKSVNWFTIILVLICINYIAFAFYEFLPALVQRSMLILLGISLIVFLYLAIYLLPLYAIGAVGFFVLGISLHVFVPLLFTIYTIALMIRLSKTKHKNWWYFSAGSLAVVTIIIVYSIQWAQQTNKINTVYREATIEHKGGLPGWVAVAQEIPQHGITEKLLKAGLVYAVPDNNRSNFFWGMPQRNFGDERFHDPLVMTATLFGGYPNLKEEDQVQLLETMFDARHEGEERLWTGDDLFTELVQTQAKIWPQFCLSYTEKTITVTNKKNRSSWRNRGEAIYTFNLPEGAVVSALSLWINGKEEKGILTSKLKAGTAYKTIVGVESRDPSVVHWQEGNRVSVRVFPVIAGESRRFKIGITAPLKRDNGKMLYENVFFKGPSSSTASEEINVQFEQPAKDIVVPAVLKNSSSVFTWKGKYHSQWSVSMGEQPISRKPFSFDGKIYTIRPYEMQREPVSIQEVYLDINSSWTKGEFEQVWNVVKNRKVSVYYKKLVPLTNENHFEYFYYLSKQPFSLFPFYEITEPSNSIVITKNEGASPNLRDLDGTHFADELKTYLTQPGTLRIFNFGNELSPYLKALKEYRVFLYERGGLDELTQILQKNEFAKNIESDQQVVLENTGVAITSIDGVALSEAPDHLMRLFSYNHIMQKKGKEMINDTAWDQPLVDEAQKAYVVTPVSSLVVLETQADYDRFGIKDSDNSLKNASIKSKGAVPEPHEWALILVAFLVLGYIRFSKLFKWNKQ